MSNPLSDLIAEKGTLLADGATGTNLFAMGLMSGDAPELWNADAPEKITKLHQDFVDAGSDVILTNSFGGTRHRLKLHDAQDRVFELNKKAAEIARAVADKCRPQGRRRRIGRADRRIAGAARRPDLRGRGGRVQGTDRRPEGRRRRHCLDRDHVVAGRDPRCRAGGDRGGHALCRSRARSTRPARR